MIWAVCRRSQNSLTLARYLGLPNVATILERNQLKCRHGGTYLFSLSGHFPCRRMACALRLKTVLASSASPKHGLFSQKIRSTPTLARRLPYRDRSGQKKGFVYVSSYNLHLDKQYQEHVQNSELLTRGWVLGVDPQPAYGLLHSICHQSKPSNNNGIAPFLRLISPSPRTFNVNTHFASLPINTPLLRVVTRERFALAGDNPTLSIAHTLLRVNGTNRRWCQRRF